MEFGAKLEMESIPEIFRCTDFCNQYGMDVISAAGAVAFLLESFDQGLIGVDGLGFIPTWGDYDTVSRLLLQIARRVGVGHILAEGVRLAAEQIPGSKRNFRQSANRCKFTMYVGLFRKLDYHH
jgi:aldehyde:ferredoxin oxidoreductase